LKKKDKAGGPKKREQGSQAFARSNKKRQLLSDTQDSIRELKIHRARGEANGEWGDWRRRVGTWGRDGKLSPKKKKRSIKNKKRQEAYKRKRVKGQLLLVREKVHPRGKRVRK